VLTAEVAGACAKLGRPPIIDKAGTAAIPINSLRRKGDCNSRFFSSDMVTPFLLEDAFDRARIAEIVRCTHTQDRVYCTAK
jgi:hypothetical protein